ncbi:MAG: hypothetical protein H0S85_09790 [Desulfovibrionaceae bacterium]|jgi:hypothetical protein|nr:hypothetical protein [Desulfovibrionaceae bacterium]
MSLESRIAAWNALDQSGQFSNSHTSKTLRLESRQFRQSAKLGDSLLFGVDIGERARNMGLFADLESSSGRIMELKA